MKSSVLFVPLFRSLHLSLPLDVCWVGVVVCGLILFDCPLFHLFNYPSSLILISVGWLVVLVVPSLYVVVVPCTCRLVGYQSDTIHSLSLLLLYLSTIQPVQSSHSSPPHDLLLPSPSSYYLFCISACLFC